MHAEAQEDLHLRLAETVLGARPKSLHLEPVDHHVVAGATKQIVRVHCTETGGIAHSFVAKHLQHDPAQEGFWRTSGDPASPFYWRREAEFYANAHPWPALPTLHSAKPLYVHWSGNSAVVVLEDLPDATAATWPLKALLALPKPLAEAQAIGAALDLPGNVTPFLNAYSARRTKLMEEAPALIRPTGIEAVDALAESHKHLAVLHRATPALLASFADMPQVISHNDFWQPNLLRGADGAAVLIDFAHCGLSAAGQDAANLVIDGIADGLIPPEPGRALFDRFLAQYAQRFAEISGAIAASEIIAVSRHAMALKYSWLIPATFKAAQSEESRARLAERHGSAERFLNMRATGLRVVADLMAETAAAYS